MASIQEKQQEIIDNFNLLGVWDEKYAYLIELGQGIPDMDPALKTDENLVKGCQSTVWFHTSCQDGIFHLDADSDSLIVRGIAALLVAVFSNQPIKELHDMDFSFLDTIGMWKNLSVNRNNGLMAMLEHIKKFVQANETC